MDTPTFVGPITALPASGRVLISLIDVPPRLRPASEAHVEILQESFAQLGQQQPIEVRPSGERFLLTAGLHRLTVATRLGWVDIAANIVERDELSARLAEIDENLIRHELTALDRAIFLAERQAVWLQMHPETAHGGDRKSRKNKEEIQVANFATRFSKDAAEKIGLSERLIQGAVRLANSFSPEVRELLRTTSIADHGSELGLLSKLAPDHQLAALEQIRAGTAANVRTAIGATPQVDPQEKLFRSLSGVWGRCDKRTRNRFLAHIGINTTAGR